MKRKEIFNKGLFFESLRRIRLPAVVMTIILTLEAILIPVGYAVSRLIMNDYTTYELGDYRNDIVSLPGMELHPFLMVFVFIAAPLFTYTIFSFMNKRNSSDFYHSLPHTRLAIYVSSISAITASILVIILFTSGVSRLFAAFFPQYISVQPGTYLPLMAGCFVTAILISACISIGMSITGTTFSNIAVTLMVMFFPRYVLSMLSLGVATKLPVVSASHLSFFLSEDINILWGGNGLMKGTSQVYSLILALVYFVIGGLLFCRRKSESAEHSAPGRFMQAVYRTVAALAVCVPVCYLIYVGNIDWSYDWFAVLIMCIGIALVYFLYELLTTRNWKNTLRAVPGLAIVATLSIIFYLSMAVVTEIESNFLPEADDIDYVQIVNDGYLDEDMMDFGSYAVMKSSTVKLRDEKVAEIVSRSLKESVDFCNDNGNLYVYLGTSFETETYEVVTFKIKSGISTKYRNVRISESDMKEVLAALSESEEYVKLWTELPAPQKGTVSAYGSALNLEAEDTNELFKALSDEVASLEFEEWYKFVNGYDDTFGYVDYVTDGVQVSVPINGELLPKTLDAMFDTWSEVNRDDMKKMQKLIQDEESAELVYAEICVPVRGYYEYRSLDFGKYDPSELQKLLSETTEASDISFGDVFVEVSINMYEDGEIYSDYTTVLKVKDGCLDKLLEYTVEYED